MSTEISYKVPLGAQEFTINRWSHTHQIQLNSIVWVLTTGEENGQPVIAGIWQAYRNQVVLATMGCNSLEELVDKYLGKVHTIKNLNTLCDEILRHERRDWLSSNGWSDAEIDKYYEADGTPKQKAEATTTTDTLGEGEQAANPPQATPKAGRTKQSSSSSGSPVPSA